MREAIAKVIHAIWGHWILNMINVGRLDGFGRLVIPADEVDRWKRQMNTSYDGLSEKEKESDRRQADKIIETLEGMTFSIVDPKRKRGD